MSKRRGHIPLKEQLAAALRQLGDIPWEHARQMDADQIISLYHCDHGIYKTWEESPGEFDKHWNLTFRFIGDHREKTKTDQGVIAKARNGAKAHAAHQTKMAAKAGIVAPEGSEEAVEPRQRSKPKAKIKSRPFDKRQRKMQSKSSFSRRISG